VLISPPWYPRLQYKVLSGYSAWLVFINKRLKAEKRCRGEPLRLACEIFWRKLNRKKGWRGAAGRGGVALRLTHTAPFRANIILISAPPFIQNSQRYWKYRNAFKSSFLFFFYFLKYFLNWTYRNAFKSCCIFYLFFIFYISSNRVSFFLNWK